MDFASLASSTSPIKDVPVSRSGLYYFPPDSLRRGFYLRTRPRYVTRFKATDVRREITQCVFRGNGVHARPEARDACDCAGFCRFVTGAVYFVIYLS